ncbi:MAG: hypothetical protein JWQ40_2739 [Segetibacter sp.]|nr:hypothetical protein [Segetibacter sp.]
MRRKDCDPSASLRGKKNATLSSIKELKVELSVATMILIVQKAGIKKTLQIKTAKTSALVVKLIRAAKLVTKKLQQWDRRVTGLTYLMTALNIVFWQLKRRPM